MPKRLFDLGRKIYELLGRCVMESIEEENSEMAVICALPLVKLAEAEGANYFGYDGVIDYNDAINLAKEALKFAEEEGVPSWLKDDLEELRKTLRKIT